MKLRIVQRGASSQDITVEDEHGNIVEGVVGLSYTASIDSPPTITLELLDVSFNEVMTPAPRVLEAEAPGYFPDAETWLVE